MIVMRVVLLNIIKKHQITGHESYLDEVELPVLIAPLDLQSLFPGRCGSDGFHAVAVRGHDIRMHNRRGQRSLGYRLLAAAPATVLTEDNGLVYMARKHGGTVGWMFIIFILHK